MTRIAPRSSPSMQASQSLLDARWRVGVRGSLALTVLPGADAESAIAVVVIGSERFVLDGQTDDSGREVRFAFSVGSDARTAPYASADGAMPENPMPENSADPHRQTQFDGFTLALCPNPSASESGRVLLTDLPTRLGLMGGTYVLESIRAGF